MLRLTQEQTNGITTLRLDGKLQGPWVGMLREEAEAVRLTGPLQLDLAQIRFVDHAGAELLRELLRSGVTIGKCSNFVRELLRMEGQAS
ncbi:MAG: hypothetical protein HY763_12000 [Planctomycetes bacterium]|nr:hypothetical protein [Planctomycetota bacterium]